MAESLTEEQLAFARGCILLQAAYENNISTVKSLLTPTNGHLPPVDVNFADYDQRTACHVAASEGHLELVRLLVEQGATLTKADRWGGSPLDDALRHRHLHVAAYLRQQGARMGADLDVSHLVALAGNGNLAELRGLVEEAGANPTAGDYDDRTPLHLASSNGHADVVAYLLSRGAHINAEDRWGNRALDDATRMGHDNVKGLLLSAGALPGRRGGGGTPGGLMAEGRGGEEVKDLASINPVLGDRGRENSLDIGMNDLVMMGKLGGGEFGDIYKCRWRGALVAAKCVKHDAMGQQGLADLRREFAILKQLRHPHIVMLFGYCSMPGREVLVSELCRCSLLDVLKQTPALGTRTSLKHAHQLAQAMTYLHSQTPAILHRDLKPANLLLDNNDDLKVSDFGLAKSRPRVTSVSVDQRGENFTDTFRMSGETGTYRYMAPEVFLWRHYNEKVDVYSFAMILYELLAGRQPFADTNPLIAVRAAAEEGVRPQIPRSWDLQVVSLLRSCWAEAASERPAFSAVLQQLEEYHRHLFGDADPIDVITPERQLSRKPSPRLHVAAHARRPPISLDRCHCVVS